MTKEEKNLLLRDLCARLPYEVILLSPNGKVIYQTDGNTAAELLVEEGWKPYLRSMLSMTEEEKENLQSFHDIISDENYSDGYSPSAWYAITAWEDYCNSKHLDYRGLIKKELAIAVTQENNPYKE